MESLSLIDAVIPDVVASRQQQTQNNQKPRLSQSHFQLFMGPDIWSLSTMEILNLVYVLVKNENRDLYNNLMRYWKPLPPPPKKKEKDSL